MQGVCHKLHSCAVHMIMAAVSTHPADSTAIAMLDFTEPCACAGVTHLRSCSRLTGYELKHSWVLLVSCLILPEIYRVKVQRLPFYRNDWSNCVNRYISYICTKNNFFFPSKKLSLTDFLEYPCFIYFLEIHLGLSCRLFKYVFSL